MCLPRLDSPSVFGAMLDRDAGGFRLGPAGVTVPGAVRYLPGTLVLETSWETRTGWVVVRDVLCIGPWYHNEERSRTHRRSPTDYDADHVLLRTVRCVQGWAEIHLDCEPVFDYGGLAAEWSYTGPGYNEATAGSEGMDLKLQAGHRHEPRVRGPARPGAHDPARGGVRVRGAGLVRAPAAHHLRGGRRAARAHRPPLAGVAQAGHLPRSPLAHVPAAQRADAEGAELRAHRGDGGGGHHLAAGDRWAANATGTTATRWIRDSTFMLWALYTLGFDWEANDFFYFVADLAEAEEGELQIMYGIGGESRLDEQELDHLSGYGGARPVRIGNGAYRQRQHDVWGAVLDSIYLHTRSRDQLPDRLWPIIKRQVAGALEHWREPDRGIWEVRGEPQHFTSSKLMCWVAADRGARLAQLREDRECAERWHAAAAEIHADICAHGVDERGVFTQHYDTTALDASLLLMPLVRFLPAEDPRIVATVAGDRRRAHRGRAGAALPRGGDRRRAQRRGGLLHDLLLLAGLRAL